MLFKEKAGINSLQQWILPDPIKKKKQSVSELCPIIYILLFFDMRDFLRLGIKQLSLIWGVTGVTCI